MMIPRGTGQLDCEGLRKIERPGAACAPEESDTPDMDNALAFAEMHILERHSREGGNPGLPALKRCCGALGPRLRGDDDVFSCRAAPQLRTRTRTAQPHPP